ncbi:MAG: hypothetical protein ACOYMZ_03515 [Minisyncoccia bacterium]
MKQYLKKHYSILALTAIVCVLVCAGFFFLLSSMKEKEVRVYEVKQMLATYRQNKKIFAQENEKMRELSMRMAALETKHITEATVPTLLSSFESMAERRGVSLSIASIQTPLIEGEKVLYVEVSASGGFAELTSLVEDMLSQAYQLRFVKLSLYEDTSGQWQMFASLEVVSF